MKRTNCLELTERFDPIYPAGHSNFRIPMEATEYRVFVKRAEGSRVWDFTTTPSERRMGPERRSKTEPGSTSTSFPRERSP